MLTSVSEGAPVPFRLGSPLILYAIMLIPRQRQIEGTSLSSRESLCTGSLETGTLQVVLVQFEIRAFRPFGSLVARHRRHPRCLPE